ncbi:MAG: hypothetical protein HQK96_14440 [Nitrospirae bacterium]|nr:hypothetical protein [Nitrospirota bacterium]
MKLSEKIFEEESNYRWLIQVIQQTLSTYFHLPIRIYDLDKGATTINNLRDYLHNNAKELDKLEQCISSCKNRFETAKFKSLIASEAASGKKPDDNILKSVACYFRNKVNSPWLTYRSVPNPFLELLREKANWKIIEQFFFFSTFFTWNGDHKQPVDLNILPYVISDKLVWTYAEWKPWDKNLAIVAGPVMKQPSEDCDNELDSEIFDAIAKDITSLFNEPDKGIDTELIKRLCSKRFPIPELVLTQRLKVIRSIFSTVLDADIAESIYPSREDITNLILIALIVRYHPQSVLDIIANTCPDGFISDEVIRTRKENFTFQLKSFKGKYIEVIVNSESSAAVSTRLTLREAIEMSSKLCVIANYPNATEEGRIRFDNTYRAIKSHLMSHKNGFTDEMVIKMVASLESDFGLVSITKKDQDKLNRMNKYITSEIAKLLTANTSSLYLYRHDMEQLYALSLYYDAESNVAKRWHEVMEKFMQGLSEDKKRQSICYRAVEDHNPHFCWAFDPKDNTITDPPGEPLIIPPQGLKSARSGIAVPIIIFGQLFGIFEVGGFSPYQFSNRNLHFLNRVGSLVGPHLYQKHVWHKLSEMNKIMLDDQTSNDGKYEIYCKHLTHIFLSHGATLWLRVKYNPDQIVAVGSYNREFIKSSPNDMKLNIGNSAAGMVLKEKRPFVDKSVNDKSLQWGIEDSKKDLIANGIERVVFFAVPHQENIPPDAIVSLYFKHPIKFSDSWDSIFSFVSHQFSMILKAMHEKQEFERKVSLIISHELNQKIKSVASRGEAIHQIVLQMVSKDKRNFSLNMYMWDLLNNVREATKLIGFFDSEGFSDLIRKNKHPIFEVIRRQIKSHEQISPVNLLRVIRQSFISRTTDYINRGISVKFPEQNEEILLIEMHRDRLKHIIDNLADNAIKYGLDGNEITIETEKRTYSQRLSISNISPCIPLEEERFMFTEGFRSSWAKELFPKNKSSKKKGIGRGLGLHLVKGICLIYGIGCQYISHPVVSVDGKEMCLHTFQLSFPKRMVLLRKKSER